MKENSGYYKFYYNKTKLTFALLLFFAAALFLLWLLYGKQSNLQPEDRFVVIGFLKLLSNPVYVEITPDYIKINTLQKLPWEAIEFADIGYYRGGTFYQFHIKDDPKYDYLSETMGHTISQAVSPLEYYSIYLGSLSKKEQSELTYILKDYIPNNKL